MSNPDTPDANTDDPAEEPADDASGAAPAEATSTPAIADDSEAPDESGTPTGDDLGAGGD
jgi:hypothetical protein